MANIIYARIINSIYHNAYAFMGGPQVSQNLFPLELQRHRVLLRDGGLQHGLPLQQHRRQTLHLLLRLRCNRPFLNLVTLLLLSIMFQIIIKLIIYNEVLTLSVVNSHRSASISASLPEISTEKLVLCLANSSLA